MYYIAPFFEGRTLKSIRGTDIQNFYNTLASKAYSKSTITLAGVVLGSMLKQAEMNDYIESNPSKKATLPRIRGKRNEKKALTEEEQKRLIEKIKGHRLENLILLALSTGMRIGELTGLLWEDIDFERGEITVRRTLKCARDTNEFYLDMPKTESSCRTIPMLPKIRERLRNEFNKNAIKNKQLEKKSAGLDKLVFKKEGGGPLSEQNVRRQLIKLAEAAEIEHLTPHTLRHTFATRALESGMPAKVVQELLGHSSITMTLDLYTHVMDSTKAREIQKMSELI